MNEIRVKKTVYVPIDAGTYDAQVDAIEAVSGEFGDQLKWTFSLDDTERTLWGWCSAKYSPKSKLAAWTRAILGRDPDGDEWKASMVLGGSCRLLVSLQSGKDGNQYNRIADVLPSKERKETAPIVAAVEAPTEEIPF